MRKLILLVAACALVFAPRVVTFPRARAQTHSDSTELPRGRVVEKVSTLADSSQTYALYLPSNYTPERRWPVLYCFDPAARGAVPVERFREAAESYGWIVVGSNNARNGPVKPALEAARAVWDDTHARLSIDVSRVYAAGFSGGARNAVRLALLCRNCIAGVVAVGGGFPVGMSPSREAVFPLFGVAGTNDYNFPEMRRLDEQLARLDFPHRLKLFDGGHSWAPASVFIEAVGWMELQAMKSARRARDEALLDALWKKAMAKARGFEEAKKFYEAYRIYDAAADDFRGLRDVSESEKKAAELRASKEVRRAIDEEAGQLRRQQKLEQELAALLAQRKDPENGAIAAADFRRMAAELRKTARGSEDTGERRVARRVLGRTFAQFHETAAMMLARGENSSAVVASLKIAAELSPDNPQLLFELACAHALNRDRKKALEVLRRAVEKGFRDADELARNDALAPLRGEPAYKELLERIKATR